jgi:hypothetical protein
MRVRLDPSAGFPGLAVEELSVTRGKVPDGKKRVKDREGAAFSEALYALTFRPSYCPRTAQFAVVFT